MVLSRVRCEVVREVLRVTHNIIPKFRRFFNYRGLKLYIPKGVFNPTFTASTDLIINALEKVVRPWGNVLEVGCGSGAISVYIAKYLRRDVKSLSACDVSELALKVSRINAVLNNVANYLKVGNCVELIPKLINSIDFGIANPPYLPLDPKDAMDINWCGGSSLKIFNEVVNYLITSLRRGGEALITASSLTSINHVSNYLRALGVKFRVIDYLRTPLDTIYLIHVMK